MNNLINYLPEYYAESSIMKTIMDTVASEFPDTANYLWKVFYLTCCPEEYLWFWQEDLDNYGDRETLLAILRARGLLNYETLYAQGLDAVETHVLSPEEGYILSGNESFFPDGKYFAPLVSDIIVPLEALKIARKIVELSGLAGFNYFFTTKLINKVICDLVETSRIRSLYPGVILPHYPAILSGGPRLRSFVLNLNEQNACIVTESAPSTIVEKWLDLPMLVDYAAGLGLNVVPDAWKMISPSVYGEISKKGVLSTGNPEDFICCLIDGDLETWLSIPTRHVRKTWQILLKEQAVTIQSIATASRALLVQNRMPVLWTVSAGSNRFSGEKRHRKSSLLVNWKVRASVDMPSTRPTVVEKWLDLPMLIDWTARSGLEVTPDALSFISLSGTGTISDDGTLAYGNPEDFTCCLYKGSLDTWINIPVRHTRKTWYYNWQMSASKPLGRSSAARGKALTTCTAKDILLLSGEPRHFSLYNHPTSFSFYISGYRPSEWSKSVSFLDDGRYTDEPFMTQYSKISISS